MPSKEHEDAVCAIMEFIAEEFNISPDKIDRSGNNFPLRLRPDLCFIKPGTEKYVVVEVGDTNAEKINKYRQSKMVCEIRWYTKRHRDNGIYLVGQWDLVLAPAVRIDRKTYKAKTMERALRDRAESLRNELQGIHLTFDSIVGCAVCGKQIPIKFLVPTDDRGKFYGICKECNAPARG